jgi:hypothetical protein
MKNLIKVLINSKSTVDFETKNDIGHIQFDGKNWAIFFNAKCVHTSKTLQPVLNKLQKLGINEQNILFEQ